MTTDDRSALFVTTVPITLEAFLAPFARHFRTDGWRVDALANGASLADAIAKDFDSRFDVAWSRAPLAPSNLLGTAARVRSIVDSGRYDIVHVHTPIAAWVTRYALRARRKQPGGPVVIYTAHGFHFYRGQKPLPHMLFRTMERVAAPWTDYLVTINLEDYEAARELGGIDRERVRYIPGIGVDTARFAPEAAAPDAARALRTELAIPAEEFVLTMIAEIAAVKRHEFALSALSQARSPNVTLLIVGDGPLEAGIRSRVDELGLSERVRFAGYRRAIPTVLAATDALLLTSEREGLNRSALEAMAACRPVVGTDTRGIADAIGSKETGWIVAKDDASALAAAIDEAATNPDEVARRGAAARERVCAEFSLDRIIDAYDGLYDEALASRV